MLTYKLNKKQKYPHDCNLHFHWLVFYYTFQQLGLTEETKPLAGLFAIAEECGPVWMFDNLCIVSERPTSLVINEQGNLHNLKGPAISWSDGYCQYYINGKFVHPDIGERLIWYLNHRKSRNQPNFSLKKELKKFQELNLEVGNDVGEKVLNQIESQGYNQICNIINCQLNNQIWNNIWSQSDGWILSCINNLVMQQIYSSIFN